MMLRYVQNFRVGCELYRELIKIFISATFILMLFLSRTNNFLLIAPLSRYLVLKLALESHKKTAKNSSENVKSNVTKNSSVDDIINKRASYLMHLLTVRIH